MHSQSSLNLLQRVPFALVLLYPFTIALTSENWSSEMDVRGNDLALQKNLQVTLSDWLLSFNFLQLRPNQLRWGGRREGGSIGRTLPLPRYITVLAQPMVSFSAHLFVFQPTVQILDPLLKICLFSELTSRPTFLLFGPPVCSSTCLLHGLFKYWAFCSILDPLLKTSPVFWVLSNTLFIGPLLVSWPTFFDFMFSFRPTFFFQTVLLSGIYCF